MAEKKIEPVTAVHFAEFKEVLEAYAVLCDQMIEKIGEKTLMTEGPSTIRRGLYSMRNLFAREMGRMCVEEPKIVETWKPPKRTPKKKSAKKIVKEIDETVATIRHSKKSPKAQR